MNNSNRPSFHNRNALTEPTYHVVLFGMRLETHGMEVHYLALYTATVNSTMSIPKEDPERYYGDPHCFANTSSGKSVLVREMEGSSGCKEVFLQDPRKNKKFKILNGDGLFNQIPKYEYNQRNKQHENKKRQNSRKRSIMYNVPHSVPLKLSSPE